jgi:hypothetical protein
VGRLSGRLSRPERLDLGGLPATVLPQLGDGLGLALDGLPERGLLGDQRPEDQRERGLDQRCQRISLGECRATDILIIGADMGTDVGADTAPASRATSARSTK